MKKFNSITDISNFILDRQDKMNSYISVFMLLGYGDKSQYKDRKLLEEKVEKIATKFIGNNSVLLYFGDVPKKEEPDIGYAIEYFSKLRPDVPIIMIQIKEMEKYGVPKFVSGVYFHDDYDKEHKWGGFELVNGVYKVFSNTKQWLKLHLLLKKIRTNKSHKRYRKRSADSQGGIDYVYVLGTGGPITQQELNFN